MLNYEIVAYTKDDNTQIITPTGSGKRAKKQAIELANKWAKSGKYEAIYVNCNNGEEIVDSECVNIPTCI